MTNTYTKPIWARFLCLILSFAVALSCTSWERAGSDAYAGDTISVKLIDRNGTEHTDPFTEYGLTFDFSGLMRNDSVLSDGDELVDGDRLSFTMSWDAGSFDSDYQDEQGRFSLVFDNLKCPNVDLDVLSRENVAGNGCSASYIMSPSDGVLRIDVTPAGKNNNFHGYCTVGLTVNVDRTTLGTGNTLLLEPISDITFRYVPGSVTPQKSRMGGIYESGGRYYQNFSIDLTHSGGNVTNVKLTDTCGSIFKDLTSSAPTFRITDDTFTDSLPDTGETLSGSVTGAHSFELNFPELSESKRIVYALEIDPENVPAALLAAKSGDNSSAKNDLKAEYNNGFEDTETPSPTVELEITQPTVGKDGTLNRNTNKIEWTISFTPGTLGTFFDPQSSDLVITDTPDGTNLTLADLKSGLTAAGIAYTEESGAVKISGAALRNDGWRYSLSYSTPVDPDLLESFEEKNFTNTTSVTFKDVTPDPVSATVPVGKDSDPGSVDKTLKNADPSALDIEWQADVEIPEAGGLTDTILIQDTSINDRWDAAFSANVANTAYLNGDISEFTFLLDGNPVNIAGSISGLEYYRVNAAGDYEWTDTFEADTDAGYRFTLNNSFISANAGKTLSIVYHTTMAGDLSGHYDDSRIASIKYINTVIATYKKSNGDPIGNPVKDTAEYMPSLKGLKFAKDGGNPNIYTDYPGGDYPVLAFWEIRVHSDEGFNVGDVITVKDKVSTGHSYYDDGNGGSAVLVTGGYDTEDYYNITDVRWRDKFPGNISVSANGSETEFTITVDTALAENAAANNNILNILYATRASDEIGSEISFGKTVTVSNSANVLINGSEQISDLAATQKLTSDGEVIKKTLDSVVKGDDSSIFGDATYTIVVNKYGQKLSDDGKVIVDDWLGGNLELPATVTVTKQRLDGGNLVADGEPVVYTVEKNPAYDSDDINSIHSFFKKGGVIAEECAVYKTGVGKKMTFNLEDSTAYKIEYTLKYEKMVSATPLESVEEAARYNNTAVIRVNGGASSSDTATISTGDYKVTAGVSAGTMENYIIFDIRKKWVGDNGGLGRPDSIKLHVTKTNLDDLTDVQRYDVDVTLHENAVQQEDGSWLFALKLPALTVDGSRVTRYSYTIEEADIAGYTASWSTALDDISLDPGDDGRVVGTELTNTSSTRFAVRKTDITGLDELEGAHIAIYNASDIGADGRPTASATPVDSWVSDGSAHYSALADGNYVLLETGTEFADSTTGKSYKVTERTVSFTISGNSISSVTGNHTGTVTDADKAAGFIEFTDSAWDRPMAEFKICDAESDTSPAELKVGKYNITTGEEVTGASIKIYDSADISGGSPVPGAAPVQSWVSEAGGHTFTLADGEYVLIESGDRFKDTVTGKNYKVTDSKFRFTVAGGVITDGEVIDSASGNGSMEYTAETAFVRINDIEQNKTVITKTDLNGTKIADSNPATFVLKAATAGRTLDGVTIGAVTYTDADIQAEFSGNEVTIKDLPDGSYTLEETVAPAGYRVVSKFTFTILDGVASSIDVPQTSGDVVLNEDGSITVKDAADESTVIVKTDSDGNQLAGAVLRIRSASGDDIGIPDYTTVTDSKWEISGLGEGTYSIEEIKAPDGYEQLTGTVDITIGGDGSITSVSGGTLTASGEVQITNEKSTLSIKKTDMTGTAVPAGNNATFKLTITEAGKNLKGVEVGRATLGNVTSYSFTGNNTEFAGLKDGTYTLEETVAPDGYKAVSTFTFTVQAGKVSSVTGTFTSGSAESDADGNLVVKDDVTSLTIDKTDMTGTAIPADNKATFVLTITEAGKNLKGMVIGGTAIATEITSYTFVGNSTEIKGIKNGRYTLEETVAPDGYKTISTFGFKVTDGVITSVDRGITDGEADISTEGKLIVKDQAETPEGPKITIKKTDITGDNEIAGAVLQLLAADNTPIGEPHTSSAAAVWEVGPLAAGTYKIRETTAPDGYKKLTADVTFTVGDDGKLVSVGEGGIKKDDTTVLVKNDITVITIDKTDMTGTAIPADNKATFVLTITEAGKNLKGMVIGGTAIDTEITTYTFEGNSTEIKGIKDGTYTLEETVAPDGYKTISTFGFKVTDGVITSVDSGITNGEADISTEGRLIVKDQAETPEGPKITIKKTDITGDNEIAGAVLQLLAADNTPIGEPHTSSDAAVWEVGPLDAGTYKIRETTAPDRYKKLTTDVTFTVGADGKVVSVGEGGIKKDDTTVLVKNDISVITITKTDMTGTAIPADNKATFVLTITEQGKTLEGAKLGETVLDAVTSVEAVGNDITLTGLPDGSYTLEETVAPQGYLAVSKFGFTVENGIVSGFTRPVTTGDIVRTPEGNLIIKDAAEVLNIDRVVTITKTDMTGTPISATNKATFVLTANGGLTLEGVKLDNTVLGAVTSVEFKGNETRFTGLADGSYTLEETVAPSGYMTVSTFNFTISDGKVTRITGRFTDGNAEVTAEGLVVMDKPVRTGNPPYTVTNTPTPENTTTPTVTSGPTDTTLPIGTTTPTDTSIPIGTTTPSDTSIPIGTTTPTDTSIPIGTTTPADTTIPIGSSGPVDTTTPTVTSGPTDTTSPVDSTGTDSRGSANGSVPTDTQEENPHTGAGMLALALAPEAALLVVFRRKKNKK